MKELKTIGITGASGSLGKVLTKIFRKQGHKVIGFSHSGNKFPITNESPNEWIRWECGKEYLLENHLERIDILIFHFNK